jgi:hypothetical protein
VGTGEACQSALERREMLLTECGEGAEGVGDAEQRRAVRVEFEVGCALGYQLRVVRFAGFPFNIRKDRTEAGSSSRSMLGVSLVPRIDSSYLHWC